MPDNLIDLNEETRRRMLDEFEADVANGAVFQSAIVAPADESRYLDVHRDAFAAGDPESFAEAVVDLGLLQDRQASGSKVNVPAASKRLAAGQFGAYYARAVASVALDAGLPIEVYRARQSTSSRPESERLLGQRLDPTKLLADLRANSSEPQLFAVLPDVNSGINIKTVR